MKPTNPIVKRIALAAASAVSILLPVAPATSHRRDGSIETIPNGDDIVDDGCSVPSLSGGIARSIELEEATMNATASCNPFGTAWGPVRKVGNPPSSYKPSGRDWNTSPGTSPDVDTENPMLTHTKNGGLES